jgi:hypothetical protein
VTGGEYRYALQLGAERERRRIRRAQRGAISTVFIVSATLHSQELRDDMQRALEQLDAATKAPKKGRK